MIRTTGGRRLPLTALAVVVAAGTAFAGAIPAEAATTQHPAAAVAADARAVTLPTPTVRYESALDEVSGIRVTLLSPDDPPADPAIGDPAFEYQLDGDGIWRRLATDYPVEFLIPASPGDHLISFRAAGTIDGVRRYSVPTAPEYHLARGYAKPYTPTAVVDGPDVTFSWDVRDAQNGFPTEGNIYYEVGDGGTVFVDPVGSVTVHVGYDSSVRFLFWYGGGGDYAGFSDQTVETGSVPGSAPLISSGTPVITGTPEYGAVLSVRTPGWQPAPVAFAYQWYADGRPISNATDPTYKVTAYDAGHRITVSVRGSRDGYVSETRTSGPTKKVAEPVITAGTPRITGNPVVGRTLTAQPGIWKPSSLELGYQWKRDGQAIPGATAKTYTLTEADRGHTVTAVVSAVIYPYDNKARASAGVKVR